MNRRAFTLVEILIGSAILVGLLIGLFQIFGATNKASVQSLWYSQRQNGARNLLNVLQSDLSRASGPSTVTDSSVQKDAWDSPENHLQYKDGVTALTPGGAEVELLRFKICQPTLSTSMESSPGSETICVLRAFGTTLNYYKEGSESMNKDFLKDAAEIDLSVTENASTQATEGFHIGGVIVNLGLKVQHDNPDLYPNAKFEEKVTARAPVQATAM